MGPWDSTDIAIWACYAGAVCLLFSEADITFRASEGILVACSCGRCGRPIGYSSMFLPRIVSNRMSECRVCDRVAVPDYICSFWQPSLFCRWFASVTSGSPKGATSFPYWGLYEYDQIIVSLCLLCLLLFRFIELYWTMYLSVSFDFFVSSQVIGWEDYTLVISFVSKGFPYKDQIEELFIVMVLLYVFPTCNIVNLLINFTFLAATYFSKARYSQFVLKVPSNRNQSINCHFWPTSLLSYGPIS